jgi:hypothetical protein
VTRSKSRGVAITGQSGVTIRDVTVDTTVGHGLFCAYEQSWNTRVPTDVRFERGRVIRGGAWTAAPGGGTNCCVRVNAASTVTIDGITADTPGAHGVFLTASTVTITDVTVRNTPGSGFNLQTGTYLVDQLTAEQTNGVGFNVNGCQRLEYGTVTLRNTAITHTSHSAAVVQNTPYVFGVRLWVYDNQQPPTGYVIGAFGAQRGTLGTVVDLVDGGDVVINNTSGLTVTKI